MLGDNLKKFRTEMGISQRELGRRVGKTGQYISYLENNKNTNPSLDVLTQISKVLNINTNDLIENLMNVEINENIIPTKQDLLKASKILDSFEQCIEDSVQSINSIETTLNELPNIERKTQNKELFRKRLRQLRKNQKMTQSELADKLNIARVSVSNYESGTRIPDIIVLVSMAEYFGVTTDYLSGNSDLKRIPYELYNINKQLSSCSVLELLEELKRRFKDSDIK